MEKLDEISNKILYWLGDDIEFWDHYLPKMIEICESHADLADEVREYVECVLGEDLVSNELIVFDLVMMTLRRVDWCGVAYQLWDEKMEEDKVRHTPYESLYC